MPDQATAIRRARQRDYWFAYAAWFVINGTWFVINLILPGGIAHLPVSRNFSSSGGIELAATGLIILLNLAVPIVLTFTRPAAALGIVAAMCTFFALVVVEAVFFLAGGYVGMLAGGSNYEGLGDTTVGLAFVGIGLLGFLVFAVFVLRAVHRRIG